MNKVNRLKKVINAELSVDELTVLSEYVTELAIKKQEEEDTLKSEIFSYWLDFFIDDLGGQEELLILRVFAKVLTYMTLERVIEKFKANEFITKAIKEEKSI